MRMVVLPAGYDPSIARLKILYPNQLDDGSISQNLYSILLFLVTLHQWQVLFQIKLKLCNKFAVSNYFVVSDLA